MIEYGLPVLFALFVWWLGTGVVLYLDGLPRRTFRWSMLGATLAAAISLCGLAWGSRDASAAGAYRAFAFGLVVWGWQAVAFYLGYVTGPRKAACPEGCSGPRHFGHAIATSLHHELALVATALVVAGLTWGAPNQVGLWTFVVLWGMHLSAKLNVFLGVRNRFESFLPEHLRYLEGFFGERSMNLLFPVSITVSTVIAAMWVRGALAADATPYEVAGFTCLATLTILAVLEHWFLVLPLPAERLWSWGLRSRGRRRSFEAEVPVTAPKAATLGSCAAGSQRSS